MARTIETLPELLSELALRDPSLPIYNFLVDGEEQEESTDTLSLHRFSLSLAAKLNEHSRPGDRALLLAPPGLSFIRGFFATQYSGLVTTATFPPHPKRVDRTLARLEGMVRSCHPSIAVVTSELLPVAERLGLPAITIEEASESVSADLPIIRPSANAPALLQYTSGSTREPKGVVLTHANLISNLKMIEQKFGHHAESCGVIWLPPYHDMGLIGGILQPLYVGFPVVLLNPLHVLQRPYRWLHAISRYRATTSGGPNFAFDLCVDSISEEQKGSLKLDSWEVAFCGAEPIRPNTWRRFSEKFESQGFRKNSFFPCYGLAEATLMVTGSQNSVAPKTRILERADLPVEKEEWMSCGSCDPEHQVLIVDPHTLQKLEEGSIGEILVSGPSVAAGYWGEAEATETTFHAKIVGSERPYLRTGDLGFLEEDQLYVTGRLKELIILGGRNHYPQDLEVSIEESHEAFASHGSYVFSIQAKEEEGIVVLCEIDPRIRQIDEGHFDTWNAAIRRCLSLEHQVRAFEIVFVRAGTLPKTTSGKKQRIRSKEMYLEGQLQRIHPNMKTLPQERDSIPLSGKGIHAASASARRLQRRLAWVMVVTPMVGVAWAIGWSWGTGIFLSDLIILILFYVLTVLGVEVGFHRHFSHRSFQAKPWVRSVLCILGSMAAQGPVLFWVATHRRHHAYSDQHLDPHSPSPTHQGWIGKIQGIWHAHVGWLFKGEVTSPMDFAPDILRDPLIFKLNQWYPAWVLLGIVVPGVLCGAISGTGIGFLRGVLWGGLVRIFLVHHATWSVNSLCHLTGKRDFQTRDRSTNIGWLALTSLGGSWHNNHHAFPSSAFTGHRSHQLDPSGWLIRVLAMSGLAWDVKEPMRRADGSHEPIS